jgi:hypothetical protein
VNVTRREAIAALVAAAGASAFGSDWLLAAVSGPAADTPVDFTPEELALMAEIADTILPPTATPGAKEAGAAAFMATAVRDCFDAPAQASFRQGLRTIEAASRQACGAGFVALTAGQRLAILTPFDREQARSKGGLVSAEPEHFFRGMKGLTFLGYFSSNIGCREALRYSETPGRYEGDVPWRKGEKDWFDPRAPG